MSKDTKIEWCDDTCNPTSGCDGCELWTPGVGGPCYAGNLHETRLSKALPTLYDPSFSNVRLIPGRMAKAARCMDLFGRDRPEKPWLNGRRRKIFVGDLCDLFSADVPFEYIMDEVMGTAVSEHGTRHDFLLLTKQPNRAARFAAHMAMGGWEWPDNVWIGTSITGKASLGRIGHLANVPARHRFLSLEPLIEDPEIYAELIAGFVDWMIVGGESNQGQHIAREFNLKWARETIRLARLIGAHPFVKQLGSNPVDEEPLTLPDIHGGEWEYWPEDLRIRELPED